MAIRFIHAADIHLGYQQYGCQQRYEDFLAALGRLVADTIDRGADFMLLAGDLFHKRVVDPYTLWAASEHLVRLRDRGIPVFAVEGNHERTYRSEEFGWLDFLAASGLIRMLNVRYAESELVLDPWDDQLKVGSYMDLETGVRVIGCKYYGASTSRVIRDLAPALEALEPKAPYTILMLHAGIQGILDHYSATLAVSDLQALRPFVDYLALGHIHKPFALDGWIHNPGSLETTSVDEVAWSDRGYYEVDIQAALAADSEASLGHTATLVRGKRRRFERLLFEVDHYVSPEELYTGLHAFLAKEAVHSRAESHPVVELQLRGVLAFSRTDLDIAHIRTMVEAAFAPTEAIIREATTPSDFDIRAGVSMDRAELERHVLRELLSRDARRRDEAESWAQVVLRLKGLALASTPAASIESELRDMLRDPVLWTESSAMSEGSTKGQQMLC